jgi:uncharacterized protein YjdB
MPHRTALRQGLLRAAAGFIATITLILSSACDSSDPAVTVHSISVSPASSTIASGASEQLTLTAAASNGSHDVTQAATWSASTPGIVTVSHGLVTAVAYGQVTLTAHIGSNTAQAAITVEPPGPVLGSSKIELDPQIPQAISTKIQEIDTPVGSAPVGSDVPLPVLPGGYDSMAIATDAQGNLLLASMTQGTEVTTLNADSTALALARIGWGPLPKGVTVTVINGAIRAAAGYPALVQAVQSALAAGTAPALALEVDTAVNTVLHQIVPSIQAHATGSSRASAKALVATPSVTSPLPFALEEVPFTGGKLGVFLDDGDTAGTVAVTNATPVYWNAVSSANDKDVLLEPTAFLQNLLGHGGAQPVPLADAGGQGFNVTIEQNHASRRANLVQVLSQLTSFELGLLFGDFGGASDETTPATGKCIGSVVDALFTDQLDTLAAEPTFDNVIVYFQSLIDFKAAKALYTSMANDCAGGAKDQLLKDGAAKSASKVLSTLKSTLGVLNRVKSAVDAVNLEGLISITVAAWPDSTASTRGVCEAAGSTAGAYQVANCTTTLQIDDLTVAVGARLTPSVNAKDAGGKDTGIPADLTWVAPTPSDQAVVTVDPKNGELTVVGTGLASVQVTTPSTGAHTTFAVNASYPFLTPNPLTLDAGAGGTLSMVDSNGNPMRADGIPVVWGSSDSTIATVVGHGNSASVGAGATAGTATILASAPLAWGDKSPSATVDVQSAGSNGTVFIYHGGILTCNNCSLGPMTVEITLTGPVPPDYDGNSAGCYENDPGSLISIRSVKLSGGGVPSVTVDCSQPPTATENREFSLIFFGGKVYYWGLLYNNLSDPCYSYQYESAHGPIKVDFPERDSIDLTTCPSSTEIVTNTGDGPLGSWTPH